MRDLHERPRRRESDTVTACRKAHDEVGRFVEWTGTNDFRAANDWSTLCTRMIHDGSSVEESVKRIKDYWYAACARERRPPRMQYSDPSVAKRLAEVEEAVHAGLGPKGAAGIYREIADEFKPEAPWLVWWAQRWERCETWSDAEEFLR